MILNDRGEIHESLEGLEMKNEEEKSEVSFERPWGAAPTIAPQDSLCLKGSGIPRQKSASDHSLPVSGTLLK